MVNVYIKLLKQGKMPAQMTEGSSGYDVFMPTRDIAKYAVGGIQQYDRDLHNKTRRTLFCIPLGFALEIPEGYEGQLRLRSSAAKKGFLIPNSPATIDSDYRGEVSLLISIPHTMEVNKGDRIAQLVFQKVPEIKFLQVDELSDTIRGSGGFGSTNIGTDNV